MTRRIFCKVLLVVVAILGLLALSNVLLAQGNSENAFEHVREVQERNTERLMAMNGVEGTAIGYNENDQLAVKVFTAGPGVRGIPQELDGVPVHVVVTGKIYARSATGWYERPVPIGVSTGHPDITAGTIGCRVTDGINVYALSNNHVYADENNAEIGNAVIQPGTIDGGSSPADDIGTLAAFEPIVFHPRARNTIDAAIALSSTSLLGNATPSGGYGAPSSTTATAYVGMAVKKYGRTTGLTEGEVYALNATVRVGYSSGTARFVGQIIITPGGFSDGGDSGSLIVTQSGNNPVGLLFAGSSTVTIANPIDLVLARFGVTVDGEEGPPPTTGSISGTVTASDGTGAIVGATVSVDTGQSATTAADGTYSINDVSTGERDVTASADGFESHTKTTTVYENQPTTVDFALNPVTTAGTVSVVSITYSTIGRGKHLLITVALEDDFGYPVADASVSIDTYRDESFYATGTGTTGTDGTLTYKLRNAPSGTYTTTVIDVTAAGLTWDGLTPDNGYEK